MPVMRTTTNEFFFNGEPCSIDITEDLVTSKIKRNTQNVTREIKK